jgi:hypothetical protein
MMPLNTTLDSERIATLTRERDEARAEAARLREAVLALESEAADPYRISTFDGWHDHSPRLELTSETRSLVRAALASTSVTDWLRERLAEQREACAREADGLGEWAAERVRTTPLVGGGR